MSQGLPTTVLGYTQAGIFTTKLSYEELNFKFSTFLSYEARNPCLRIGDVIGSFFFPSVGLPCHVSSMSPLSGALACELFLFFFERAEALRKNKMCLQMGWCQVHCQSNGILFLLSVCIKTLIKLSQYSAC